MPRYRGIRSRRVQIVLGVVLSSGALAIGASSAAAGEYVVYACHTPNGGFASTEGWTFGGDNMKPTNTINDCTVNGVNNPNGSLTAAVAGRAEYHGEETVWIRFDAPQGVTVDSYRVGMCATKRSDGAFSIAPVMGRSWLDANPSDPRVFFVYWTGEDRTTPYRVGCASTPYWRSDPGMGGTSNFVERSGFGASQVWFTSWCWEFCNPALPPAGSASCTVDLCANTVPPSAVSIATARMTLTDNQAPTVSRVVGTLASATNARGRLAARFDAADVGAGVYRAVVDVRLNQSGDWRNFVDTIVDPRGGRCAPAGVSESKYEFLYSAPCETSVQDGNVSFDTAVLPPGDHLVRMQLEDAAGNRVDAIPARILHVNDPRDSSPFSGGSDNPSQPLPPVAFPANNGRRASVKAMLRVTPGRTVGPGTRGSVGGRLVDDLDRPIADARLQVDWRKLAPRHGPFGSTWRPLGTVKTDRNGRFAAKIPVGASRLLRFSYRANLDQPGFTSTAETALRVRARVRAHAARATVRNGRAAVFRGRISGPVPRGGVAITLQAWVTGRGWTPARTEQRDPRTDAGGRFTVSYRFARTFERIRYRFRVVSGEDSSYGFLRSGSGPVDVVVIPQRSAAAASARARIRSGSLPRPPSSRPR